VPQPKEPWQDPDLVAVFDELPLWSAPFGLALLEAVQLHARTVALDIGCGTGFPLLELAERLGPTARVHGIDPWREAIDRIHQKVRQYGILNVEVLEGVAEALPFADATFDLIVSNNGLNNVQDQPRALAECYRVSRPGAQFVLTMNLPDSMHELYAVLRTWLEETGRTRLLPAVAAQIASKRQPRAATEAQLAAAGFRIANVIERAFTMRFASGAALLRHHLIRLAFLPGWTSIVPEADAAALAAGLETQLDAIAAQRREITLTIPFVCLDCRRA
jgi:ubiquinone/menaquinone biosynthesis C-methylase UbiE